VNEPDDRGYYPLHMACQEGRINIVKLLIENGVNLDAKDDNGHGEPALLRAVGAGHLRIVNYLIKRGCDVNERRNGGGDTPLHIACGWGHLKQAVVLLRAGADIDALDDEKRTPVYYAVTQGHIEIVDFMFKKGCLEVNNTRKRNVLIHIAEKNNDKKMLRLLKVKRVRP